MKRTIGTTGIFGLNIFNPSMADVTVIEGVITPSARSAAPPIMVRTAAHVDFFFIRAKRAKIPPSPLLSALRTMVIHFMVVEKVRVQKIHERPPYTRSSLKLSPPPISMARIV
jgi:hypothetical protein